MDKEYLFAKPQGRCNERFIKKNFPEEYDKVLLCYGDKFAEKLYNYLYNSPSHICPVCRKETPFRTILYGYSQFCSVECSYKSKLRSEKIKNTCLNKYGVENVSQNKDIKQKKLDTITKNYGGIGFASKEIRDKSNNTIKNKYGVENVSQNEDIKQKKLDTFTKNHRGIGFASKELKEKAFKTLFKNYGVINPYQINSIKERARKKYYEKFYNENSLVKSINHNTLMYTCYCTHKDTCNKCSSKEFEISNIGYSNRKQANCELCTKLSPENTNNYKNTTIELFIQDLLTKHNIKFEANVRNVIYPQELDIYIPEKKIAIECNGCYWHSKLDSNYHYDKFNKCKDKGIQLLSIWEDWIKIKPEIIESIILSKLGIYKERIYARNCIIKEIQSKECNNFLKEHHIQGKTNSSIRLGLYYNDELVSVMVFNKPRSGVGKYGDYYELSRFCNKKHIQVIGGASKLFKYFLKTYNVKSVKSYSANDLSNGKLYNLLGFESNNKINQSYWYIEYGTLKRYHRYNFRKVKLKEMGFDTILNTEEEIMKTLPYYKIYDTGTTTWIYTNK